MLLKHTVPLSTKKDKILLAVKVLKLASGQKWVLQLCQYIRNEWHIA